MLDIVHWVFSFGNDNDERMGYDKTIGNQTLVKWPGDTAPTSRRGGATHHNGSQLAALGSTLPRRQVVSNAPERTAGNRVIEETVERGGGHDKEDAEDVADPTQLPP